MRKVCFVTNYNYDKYLPFCLNSLLRQTVSFDVIYVVDDGSEDRSRTIINEFKDSFPGIVPLLKDNAGQISCFNFVSDYLTEDDLVWCIDSDDYYPPDYVELFLDKTRDSKSEFFFCKPIQFSTDESAPKTSYLGDGDKIDFILSVQMSRLTRCYIGGGASALVISGRLFKDILPYPFEDHWKTCADEVLVHASSLAGYSKTYLPSLCYGYRVHDSNNEAFRVLSHEDKKNRKKNRDFIFEWYVTKYELNAKTTLSNIIKEYKSISSYELPPHINLSLHRLLKKFFINKFVTYQ